MIFLFTYIFEYKSRNKRIDLESASIVRNGNI